jgi:hypothetical protein
LLEDVRRAQSAVLVIRGEAGVGKTALLRYTAGRASDFRVAHIGGVESEMELAFAGLHELCTTIWKPTDVLPEPQQVALRVAFGLSSGRPPDRLLVALATLGLLFAVAEEQRLLCVVDDLQWLTMRARGFSSSSPADSWPNRWGWCSGYASRAATTTWLACPSCRCGVSTTTTHGPCWTA